jgi:hypothetical protein
MAQHEDAIFDTKNPASPVSVTGAQTALLLLDYHSFIVGRCGEAGAVAVAKANSMREWAQANGALIIHGLIDINQTCPAHFKVCRLCCRGVVMMLSVTW